MVTYDSFWRHLVHQPSSQSLLSFSDGNSSSSPPASSTFPSCLFSPFLIISISDPTSAVMPLVLSLFPASPLLSLRAQAAGVRSSWWWRIMEHIVTKGLFSLALLQQRCIKEHFTFLRIRGVLPSSCRIRMEEAERTGGGRHPSKGRR